MFYVQCSCGRGCVRTFVRHSAEGQRERLQRQSGAPETHPRQVGRGLGRKEVEVGAAREQLVHARVAHVAAVGQLHLPQLPAVGRNVLHTQAPGSLHSFDRMVQGMSGMGGGDGVNSSVNSSVVMMVSVR